MKKVVIVTGASRGIGKAIASRLVAEDYAVIGFYHSKPVQIEGVDMKKVDVTDEAEIKNAIDDVVKTYGQIDVLVNNAGINVPASIQDCTLDNWNNIMRTDATSVFLMCKYSLPYLKPNEAVIVNISSRMGSPEYANPRFLPYGSAKAVVNNLTAMLSKDLKPKGIRVNAVIPAHTETDLLSGVYSDDERQVMKDKGTLGVPEDVAGLVMKVVNDPKMNGELVFDDRVFL